MKYVLLVCAGLLKASVALMLQLDWASDAASLQPGEVKSAIFPALLTWAHLVGRAAQAGSLPLSEAIALLHSITQASPHTR